MNTKDNLTGLHNELELINEFSNFQEKNGRLIMIDLQRFKKINDLFGHQIGDKCLIEFGEALKKYFLQNASQLFRLHGDEFAILTILNEQEIRTNLLKVNKEITSNVSLPPISFNAGDVLIKDFVYYDALELADYIMYKAKKISKFYIPYSEELKKEKMNKKKFALEYDNSLKENNFTYQERLIYGPEKQRPVLAQIYTKDKDGHSFLGNGNYVSLNDNTQAQQLDYQNMQNLENIANLNQKNIILLNRKTLLHGDILLKNIEKLNRANLQIIYASDLRNLDRRDINETIDMIKEICKTNQFLLDKYDSGVPDKIIENVPVKYVRIDVRNIINSLNNINKIKYIQYKLELLNKLGYIIIYDFINNSDDYEIIKSLFPNIKHLVSGNLFGNEIKIRR